MKFHWFHLMPYPELPDDFVAKHHSVWVDYPNSEFDPAVGHRAYSDYLGQLEFAGEVGFDGICVNEHHSNAYGLMPSPNLMASILARTTTKPKIVVMGNSVALYNPAVRVAEEMAMIDVLSNGRLVAGFPVGTPMDTAFCMGQNPATLREKYREGVDLVLKAWTRREPFAFNGKYNQLRYVNVWPRPVQQPHPPVWIPGGGSIETWGWCVENDFLYAYLSYFGYKRARAMMESFWEEVDRRGAEMNPYRAGFLQFVAVAENEAEAERLYGPAACYFYNRALRVGPGFTNPPGYSTLATLRKGIGSQVVDTTALPELTWKDIVNQGFVVTGTPDSVAQQLNEMADVMRVGHLMMLFHFGNLPDATVRYNTERFAREVAPKLRHRFSEWEDRWWPKDPAAAGTAAPVAALA
jgi:alkanesulfonate monooxygenase SsuD/methylene tetrahydromethanopterin reductase-like flavin-dependent oxidoreductase (luciferase family)